MGVDMIDVKMWLPMDELDFTARDQIKAVRSHPLAVDHVAIMPDCHGGYGVPIGTIFSTEGGLIPNAVGVDIGCGMAIQAVSGEFVNDRELWVTWANRVRELVPTGNGPSGNHENSTYTPFIKRPYFHTTDFPKEFVDRYEKQIIASPYQQGTLGGGNHFLEALRDEHGNVYVMVHSGSRGIGAKVAEYYHRKAIEQSRELKCADDLAALMVGTPEADQYVGLLYRLLIYARESRALMIDAMHRAFIDVFGTTSYANQELNTDNTHNHLFTYDHNKFTHRKGATPAGEGMLGTIPGSMGTNTFVVRGKGNPDSHESASHGSGRTMGRNVAKKTIPLDDFVAAMGNTFTEAHERHLDESPLAYKDVRTVIERQADLVDVVHELTPIITVKG